MLWGAPWGVPWGVSWPAKSRIWGAVHQHGPLPEPRDHKKPLVPWRLLERGRTPVSVGFRA